MSTQHLLIDTDPGVDDALAILMACEHAQVHGLSVAAGNTGLAHTLRNACILADLHAQPLPVFPGCAAPLVCAPLEDAVHVHGEDGLGDAGLAPPRSQPAAEHAAQALLRLTREHPGKLTLVALAPLTNLALAVRLDPDFPARVGRLVVMGGAVNAHGNMGTTSSEFNVGFDPEAAHVVFEAFTGFDLVDWELCVRHAFASDRFEAWLAAGDQRAQFMAQISGKARRYNARLGRAGVISADAVAMAVALDPAVVTRSEQRAVGVELQGSLSRGMTVVDWEQRSPRPANANIALDLDQDRLERLVARALGCA